MKKYNPFGYDEFAPVVGVTQETKEKGKVCSVCAQRNPAGVAMCVYCGNELASDDEIAEMLRNLRRRPEPVEEAAEEISPEEAQKEELVRLINETVADAVSRAVPTPAEYAEEAKKAVTEEQERLRAEEAEKASSSTNSFDAEQFRKDLSKDFADIKENIDRVFRENAERIGSFTSDDLKASLGQDFARLLDERFAAAPLYGKEELKEELSREFASLLDNKIRSAREAAGSLNEARMPRVKEEEIRHRLAGELSAEIDATLSSRAKGAPDFSFEELKNDILDEFKKRAQEPVKTDAETDAEITAAIASALELRLPKTVVEKGKVKGFNWDTLRTALAQELSDLVYKKLLLFHAEYSAQEEVLSAVFAAHPADCEEFITGLRAAIKMQFLADLKEASNEILKDSASFLRKELPAEVATEFLSRLNALLPDSGAPAMENVTAESALAETLYTRLVSDLAARLSSRASISAVRKETNASRDRMKADIALLLRDNLRLSGTIGGEEFEYDDDSADYPVLREEEDSTSRFYTLYREEEEKAIGYVGKKNARRPQLLRVVDDGDNASNRTELSLMHREILGAIDRRVNLRHSDALYRIKAELWLRLSRRFADAGADTRMVQAMQQSMPDAAVSVLRKGSSVLEVPADDGASFSVKVELLTEPFADEKKKKKKKKENRFILRVESEGIHAAEKARYTLYFPVSFLPACRNVALFSVKKGTTEIGEKVAVKTVLADGSISFTATACEDFALTYDGDVVFPKERSSEAERRALLHAIRAELHERFRAVLVKLPTFTDKAKQPEVFAKNLEEELQGKSFINRIDDLFFIEKLSKEENSFFGNDHSSRLSPVYSDMKADLMEEIDEKMTKHAGNTVYGLKARLFRAFSKYPEYENFRVAVAKDRDGVKRSRIYGPVNGVFLSAESASIDAAIEVNALPADVLQKEQLLSGYDISLGSVEEPVASVDVTVLLPRSLRHARDLTVWQLTENGKKKIEDVKIRPAQGTLSFNLDTLAPFGFSGARAREEDETPALLQAAAAKRALSASVRETLRFLAKEGHITLEEAALWERRAESLTTNNFRAWLHEEEMSLRRRAARANADKRTRRTKLSPTEKGKQELRKLVRTFLKNLNKTEKRMLAKNEDLLRIEDVLAAKRAEFEQKLVSVFLHKQEEDAAAAIADSKREHSAEYIRRAKRMMAEAFRHELVGRMDDGDVGGVDETFDRNILRAQLWTEFEEELDRLWNSRRLSSEIHADLALVVKEKSARERMPLTEDTPVLKAFTEDVAEKIAAMPARPDSDECENVKRELARNLVNALYGKKQETATDEEKDAEVQSRIEQALYHRLLTTLSAEIEQKVGAFAENGILALPVDMREKRFREEIHHRAQIAVNASRAFDKSNSEVVLSVAASLEMALWKDLRKVFTKSLKNVSDTELLTLSSPKRLAEEKAMRQALLAEKLRKEFYAVFTPTVVGEAKTVLTDTPMEALSYADRTAIKEALSVVLAQETEKMIREKAAAVSAVDHYNLRNMMWARLEHSMDKKMEARAAGDLSLSAAELKNELAEELKQEFFKIADTPVASEGIVRVRHAMAVEFAEKLERRLAVLAKENSTVSPSVLRSELWEEFVRAVDKRAEVILYARKKRSVNVEKVCAKLRPEINAQFALTESGGAVLSEEGRVRDMSGSDKTALRETVCTAVAPVLEKFVQQRSTATPVVTQLELRDALWVRIENEIDALLNEMIEKRPDTVIAVAAREIVAVLQQEIPHLAANDAFAPADEDLVTGLAVELAPTVELYVQNRTEGMPNFSKDALRARLWTDFEGRVANALAAQKETVITGAPSAENIYEEVAASMKEAFLRVLTAAKKTQKPEQSKLYQQFVLNLTERLDEWKEQYAPAPLAEDETQARKQELSKRLGDRLAAFLLQRFPHFARPERNTFSGMTEKTREDEMEQLRADREQLKAEIRAELKREIAGLAPISAVGESFSKDELKNELWQVFEEEFSRRLQPTSLPVQEEKKEGLTAAEKRLREKLLSSFAPDVQPRLGKTKFTRKDEKNAIENELREELSRSFPELSSGAVVKNPVFAASGAVVSAEETAADAAFTARTYTPDEFAKLDEARFARATAELSQDGKGILRLVNMDLADLRGTATVTLPLTEAETALNATDVVYVEVDGKPVSMNAVTDRHSGVITFATDHFSTYAIVASEKSLSALPAADAMAEEELSRKALRESIRANLRLSYKRALSAKGSDNSKDKYRRFNDALDERLSVAAAFVAPETAANPLSKAKMRSLVIAALTAEYDKAIDLMAREAEDTSTPLSTELLHRELDGAFRAKLRLKAKKNAAVWKTGVKGSLAKTVAEAEIRNAIFSELYEESSTLALTIPRFEKSAVKATLISELEEEYGVKVPEKKKTTINKRKITALPLMTKAALTAAVKKELTPLFRTAIKKKLARSAGNKALIEETLLDFDRKLEEKLSAKIDRAIEKSPEKHVLAMTARKAAFLNEIVGGIDAKCVREAETAKKAPLVAKSRIRDELSREIEGHLLNDPALREAYREDSRRTLIQRAENEEPRGITEDAIALSYLAGNTLRTTEDIRKIVREEAQATREEELAAREEASRLAASRAPSTKDGLLRHALRAELYTDLEGRIDEKLKDGASPVSALSDEEIRRIAREEAMVEWEAYSHLYRRKGIRSEEALRNAIRAELYADLESRIDEKLKNSISSAPAMPDEEIRRIAREEAMVEWEAYSRLYRRKGIRSEDALRRAIRAELQAELADRLEEKTAKSSASPTLSDNARRATLWVEMEDALNHRIDANTAKEKEKVDSAISEIRNDLLSRAGEQTEQHIPDELSRIRKNLWNDLSSYTSKKDAKASVPMAIALASRTLDSTVFWSGNVTMISGVPQSNAEFAARMESPAKAASIAGRSRRGKKAKTAGNSIALFRTMTRGISDNGNYYVSIYVSPQDLLAVKNPALYRYDALTALPTEKIKADFNAERGVITFTVSHLGDYLLMGDGSAWVPAETSLEPTRRAMEEAIRQGMQRDFERALSEQKLSRKEETAAVGRFRTRLNQLLASTEYTWWLDKIFYADTLNREWIDFLAPAGEQKLGPVFRKIREELLSEVDDRIDAKLGNALSRLKAKLWLALRKSETFDKFRDTFKNVEFVKTKEKIFWSGNNVYVSTSAADESASFTAVRMTPEAFRKKSKKRSETQTFGVLKNDRFLNFYDMKFDGFISGNGKKVTVTILLPSSQRNADGLSVWHILPGGGKERISGAEFDPIRGTLTFETTHFSFFAVGGKRRRAKDESDAVLNMQTAREALRESMRRDLFVLSANACLTKQDMKELYNECDRAINGSDFEWFLSPVTAAVSETVAPTENPISREELNRIIEEQYRRIKAEMPTLPKEELQDEVRDSIAQEIDDRLFLAQQKKKSLNQHIAKTPRTDAVEETPAVKLKRELLKEFMPLVDIRIAEKTENQPTHAANVLRTRVRYEMETVLDRELGKIRITDEDLRDEELRSLLRTRLASIFASLIGNEPAREAVVASVPVRAAALSPEAIKAELFVELSDAIEERVRRTSLDAPTLSVNALRAETWAGVEEAFNTMYGNKLQNTPSISAARMKAEISAEMQDLLADSAFALPVESRRRPVSMDMMKAELWVELEEELTAKLVAMQKGSPEVSKEELRRALREDMREDIRTALREYNKIESENPTFARFVLKAELREELEQDIAKQMQKNMLELTEATKQMVRDEVRIQTRRTKAELSAELSEEFEGKLQEFRDTFITQDIGRTAMTELEEKQSNNAKEKKTVLVSKNGRKVSLPHGVKTGDVMLAKKILQGKPFAYTAPAVSFCRETPTKDEHHSGIAVAAAKLINAGGEITLLMKQLNRAYSEMNAWMKATGGASYQYSGVELAWKQRALEEEMLEVIHLAGGGKPGDRPIAAAMRNYILKYYLQGYNYCREFRRKNYVALQSVMAYYGDTAGVDESKFMLSVWDSARKEASK